GLLMRDDVDRARGALQAVCANQFDAPGEIFHGTFARAPEDPPPPDEPQIWIDYDPNWRQFIGCTFALIVDDFPDVLSDELMHAIALAVGGEPPDRIVPSYSNIALMRAWLDAWAGEVARGEAFAQAVALDVEKLGGFAEFNSPTYYGVNLFALALWRARPPTPVFERLGRELERKLWAEIEDFWHPALRNL